ncbi:hypothetical protein PVNG_06618 [Plasmodium vivax North Korean]|uniref:Uncharacterized protein n=1 Tax=Plasmodium vivax North Korean TaxID=1035514 RepID=A0A0J9WF38_PLAVI|nr:hypothetical protein PVNG_06618 [Plasmodium vivax North Korean]
MVRLLIKFTVKLLFMIIQVLEVQRLKIQLLKDLMIQILFMALLVMEGVTILRVLMLIMLVVKLKTMQNHVWKILVVMNKALK